MSTSEQASTSDTGTSERVLRLHVWGSHATLPTLDPTSLYAAALLHATFTHNEQVRIQLASASTSLARVPLLQVLDEHSETVQLIDSVDEIRSFCTSAGLDAAVAADAEKAAKQTALHALLDDQLLDLTLHSLFSLPSNYRTVTAPAYSAVGGVRPLTSSNPLAKLAALPAAFQPSIPARLRNVVEARLTAAGLWGLGGKEVAMQSSESDDLAARAGIVPTKKRGLGASAKQATRDEFERSKLINRARDVLDVVSAALPSSPALYMLDAPEPSSVDAHVLAYLAPLVFAQPNLPIDALPRLIESSYPTLAAYLATVRERLFPARATWVSPSDVQSSPPVLAGTQASSSLLSYFWPFDSSSKASDFAPPPTGTDTRSHARPTAPSSAPRPARPNGAPSQSPEDRRLRWGRALWICSALVGLVGYTFASGIVSVQFVDSDTLDDDDDDDYDERRRRARTTRMKTMRETTTGAGRCRAKMTRTTSWTSWIWRETTMMTTSIKRILCCTLLWLCVATQLYFSARRGSVVVVSWSVRFRGEKVCFADICHPRLLV